MLTLAAFSIWDRHRSVIYLDSPPKSSPPTRDLKIITDKFKAVRDKYNAPKYPIVLCHGLSGFDTLVLFQSNVKAKGPSDESYEQQLATVSDGVSNGSFMLNYWFGIEEALTAAGATVITAKVPPFGTIAERAEALDGLISQKVKEIKSNDGERMKINLVGHSMGGLDSRYLVSKIQSDDSPYEVVSLTTVATPHKGSECADFVMGIVQKDENLLKICPRAIPQLTTSYMAEFNKEVPDKPSVAYYSYGALMNPSGLKLFRATYEIMKLAIQAKGGLPDNDGMVSVELSIWGEYLGTLQNVDHLDLINWTNTIKATVDRVIFDKLPEFNPIALYLDIAETLSKAGY